MSTEKGKNRMNQGGGEKANQCEGKAEHTANAGEPNKKGNAGHNRCGGENNRDLQNDPRNFINMIMLNGRVTMMFKTLRAFSKLLLTLAFRRIAFITICCAAPIGNEFFACSEAGAEV